jgi:hypothetical protein
LTLPPLSSDVQDYRVSWSARGGGMHTRWREADLSCRLIHTLHLPGRSVVPPRVRPRSYWPGPWLTAFSTHARTSGSRMLHSATMPRGTFPFTFLGLCWTRYTSSLFTLTVIGALRRSFSAAFARENFWEAFGLFGDLGQFIRYY